ncbi:fructokinase [Clostridium polyendosporum]|uniref:Fructokinase n=1 Tax=Clostridium polyendosporum TaxID=69208 RepID=A0A919VIA6_9CLOT|nr:carbohydrate kinase [Clostridium polyendosporum]GIM30556.1 fructokinase [Clostridium polyendosporum]
MSKVISIGEALIDFIPQQKGKTLKDVDGFLRVPGGAPLNVIAAVCKLGGRGMLLTKLGVDAFGDKILEDANILGIDTLRVLRTKEANTALAFVSLREDGERDFSFYRNPSADMLLSEDEINKEDFEYGDILHFCSVSLIDAPIKNAHEKAIEYAKANGVGVSFDPHIRLPLWDSEESCREAVLESLPYADIVKISDEELEFITGIKDEEKALKSLFVGDVKAVVYTTGSKGAKFITTNLCVESDTFEVKVEDTTGAGDSFIGSLLYQLSANSIKIEDLNRLDKEKIKELLKFSNGVAALTVSKKGAMAALPTRGEVEDFINKNQNTL